MLISGYLKKALSWHHYPLVALAAAFHHFNKGFFVMTEVSLVVGSKRTVHVVGLDTFEQEVALSAPATGSIDNTAVASVEGRADLTNAFDVTGVTVGTASLTVASGGLTLVLPVIVTADEPVSLSVSVDAAVQATPVPTPAPEPAAA
jgi:hypothetical protein